MDEHSLQSPFLFEVYQKALKPSLRKKVIHQGVEVLRRQLIRDKRSIQVNNFGSGSSLPTYLSKQIKSIARSGISDRKQSEIFVNLIETHNCKNLLELGTSLGLNTIYMSLAEGVEQLVTIDGNEELMQLAQDHFTEFNCTNIKPVVSDIDQYLDQTTQPFDFIYIDANHTYEATIRYFKKSMKMITSKGIIVVDDINWSPNMSSAWLTIITEYANNLYVENAKLGIVFAGKESEKSHYILRF